MILYSLDEELYNDLCPYSALETYVSIYEEPEVGQVVEVFAAEFKEVDVKDFFIKQDDYFEDWLYDVSGGSQEGAPDGLLKHLADEADKWLKERSIKLGYEYIKDLGSILFVWNGKEFVEKIND